MKEKKFDCVKMKQELQAKVLKEIEGLSVEERRKDFEKRMATDPILGPIWRGAKKVPPDEDRGEPNSETTDSNKHAGR